MTKNKTKFKPMKPARFAELTGYTICAINKQREKNNWVNHGIAFKICNEWLYDYEGWKKWVKKQIELQKASGEHLTVVTKSPLCTTAQNAVSVSKVSPQKPTMQM